MFKISKLDDKQFRPARDSLIWVHTVCPGHLSENFGSSFAGNKKDLENQREVNFVDAKQFAQQNSMIGVIESSAKDNINIDETFIKLAKVWNVILFCKYL